MTDSNNPNSISDHVKYVDVPYVTYDECHRQWQSPIGSFSADILPSMMCAGKIGKDTCKGDSGGPLIDTSSNKLVGVTSFGDDPCGNGMYGVYSRISNQWETWIKPTICGKTAHPMPTFCPHTVALKSYQNTYMSFSSDNQSVSQEHTSTLTNKEKFELINIGLGPNHTERYLFHNLETDKYLKFNDDGSVVQAEYSEYDLHLRFNIGKAFQPGNKYNIINKGTGKHLAINPQQCHVGIHDIFVCPTFSNYLQTNGFGQGEAFDIELIYDS